MTKAEKCTSDCIRGSTTATSKERMQVACGVGRRKRGRGQGFAWCVARGGNTLLFINRQQGLSAGEEQLRQTSNRVMQKEAC